MSKANTVCVDFDWTLCSNDEFGKPNKEIVELIKELYKERYEIVIYTSRDANVWETISFGHRVRKNDAESSIEKWLKKHKLNEYISNINYNKPEAVAYIDDRAIRYQSRYSIVSIDKFLQKDKQTITIQQVRIIEQIKKESEALLK